MVLQGSSFGGRRRVNTITGEDPRIQVNPASEHLIEGQQASYGAMGYYVMGSHP
jgi:hypothetical protein